MKKVNVVMFIVIIGMIGFLFGGCTAKQDRAIKDIQSNWGGGLNRTITIYDMNGELVKTYTGKFDVEFQDNNVVKFDDENGKRHLIQNNNGIICIDEN